MTKNSSATMTFRSRAVLFALLPLAFAGCARPPSALTGRVYFRDQPVTCGTVVVYCEGQRIVRGPIQPDGTYSVPNVPPGDVRIAVVPPLRMPEGFRLKLATPPVHDGPIMPGSGRAADDKFPAIPKRYGMPEESELTATVGRTSTEFDIRLTR